MIMPRAADQLLLPANPLFIAFTLLVALAAMMLPLGRHPAAPDLLAVALAAWSVHQPRRVGVGVGFVLGLVVDVHSGAVLGQQALAYTLLAFFSITIHRRLLWFSLPAQALQILPLFVLTHAVALLGRMAAGGMFPGWWLFAAPLFEAALWPLAVWLLLAPQRRAPDRDANRPL
jgi:rod shape-determining protein MreD